MKIIIKETQKIETLSIIDPKTGVDYISDFVGNTGALIDGQFEWNEDRDAYICDQETYDWWKEGVASNQKLVNRTHELVKELSEIKGGSILSKIEMLLEFYNKNK